MGLPHISSILRMKLLVLHFLVFHQYYVLRGSSSQVLSTTLGRTTAGAVSRHSAASCAPVATTRTATRRSAHRLPGREFVGSGPRWRRRGCPSGPSQLPRAVRASGP